MKYIIVLGDGMADEPIASLCGKTPLEAAETPTMDWLAKRAEIGMACMVPEGMSPGSDTANLSVLGYDPRRYYTGRSPLEALSIGVDLKETDVSLRCNLVTLSEGKEVYEERYMIDHSSSEISTEDAAILIDALREGLRREGYEFYVGTSYRHLVVWNKGEVVELTPPHDILTKQIGAYLPQEQALREMMEKSFEILSKHPLNQKRKEQGRNPANSIWFWGAGTKPELESFSGKTGKKAAMISAVDLLKGIAVGSEMENLFIEGATGGLHTNYEGKAEAAVNALLGKQYDFVYVHVEAPDEMGHQGLLEEKIRAIEYLDRRLIRLIVEKMEQSEEEYRILILPDHPTPVRVRTHTGEPVPYLLYDSRKELGCQTAYSESNAKKTGIIEKEGYRLITRLLEG